ncbi:unnamed protein product [Blepharisma stoltei]|uniref:Uncharacterized protein n=1 Tax=Blepharisma stoltei TaxID=1481888 RepID=A0AAU9JJX3_9CILI|nr:unnamed protein product [Blepharisma stoltei]
MKLLWLKLRKSPGNNKRANNKFLVLFLLQYNEKELIIVSFYKKLLIIIAFLLAFKIAGFLMKNFNVTIIS